MMAMKWLAPAGLAALALAVTACGSSTPGAAAGTSTSSPAATSSSSAATTSLVVKTTKISGTTVLTNSSGYTLYWFGPDTKTKSSCDASCASYWPPVKGPVTAGSGVTGTFGTIKRSDGTLQATWDGHPLYTYVGDSSPGQDNGNKMTSSGGEWWAVSLSSSSSTTGSTGTTTGGGGGGW